MGGASKRCVAGDIGAPWCFCKPCQHVWPVQGITLGWALVLNPGPFTSMASISHTQKGDAAAAAAAAALKREADATKSKSAGRGNLFYRVTVKVQHSVDCVMCSMMWLGVDHMSSHG